MWLHFVRRPPFPPTHTASPTSDGSRRSAELSGQRIQLRHSRGRLHPAPQTKARGPASTRVSRLASIELPSLPASLVSHYFFHEYHPHLFLARQHLPPRHAVVPTHKRARRQRRELLARDLLRRRARHLRRRLPVLGALDRGYTEDTEVQVGGGDDGIAGSVGV